MCSATVNGQSLNHIRAMASYGDSGAATGNGANGNNGNNGNNGGANGGNGGAPKTGGGGRASAAVAPPTMAAAAAAAPPVVVPPVDSGAADVASRALRREPATRAKTSSAPPIDVEALVDTTSPIVATSALVSEVMRYVIESGGVTVIAGGEVVTMWRARRTATSPHGVSRRDGVAREDLVTSEPPPSRGARLPPVREGERRSHE